jgi:predicted AlkP superfamily pyrophosphatase or phosphodiesterase
VEYTDELIGAMLGVLPKDYAVALVSDHGFERTDTVVNLGGVLKDVTITPYLLLANNEQARAQIRQLARDSRYGIGPEVPVAELQRRGGSRYASAVAAWEPAPHFAFSPAAGPELHGKPREKGNHGLWPLRHDYRSVFVLWGAGVQRESLPEIEMTSIARRLAAVLGLNFPANR